MCPQPEAYAGGIARERAASIKQALSVGAISPAKVTSTTSEETAAQLGGASGKGIMHTISVELLGEAVPHKSTFFMFSDQDRKAYIYTQVAIEDFTRVAPGFNAILASFRSNKP